MGGVSGRAGAKAGGSDPSASNTRSFAWRDGERHPGFREGGALRGASSERRPRWARRARRVSSRSGRSAHDSGCPKVAEEGNAVGMRHQAHAPGAGTRDRRMRKGDSVLRSVLRPVHVDPHYAPRRKLRRWGVRRSIAVGQTRASGRNRHRGFGGRTKRGSPRVTALATRKGVRERA